jgi:hypothetical protein
MSASLLRLSRRVDRSGKREDRSSGEGSPQLAFATFSINLIILSEFYSIAGETKRIFVKAGIRFVIQLQKRLIPPIHRETANRAAGATSLPVGQIATSIRENNSRFHDPEHPVRR